MGFIGFFCFSKNLGPFFFQVHGGGWQHHGPKEAVFGENLGWFGDSSRDLFLGWWKRDPFKGLSDLQRSGDDDWSLWITWWFVFSGGFFRCFRMRKRCRYPMTDFYGTIGIFTCMNSWICMVNVGRYHILYTDPMDIENGSEVDDGLWVMKSNHRYHGSLENA